MDASLDDLIKKNRKGPKGGGGGGGGGGGAKKKGAGKGDYCRIGCAQKFLHNRDVRAIDVDCRAFQLRSCK